jgi:O-antigen ligase
MSSNLIVDPNELKVLNSDRSRTPRILDQVLVFGLCALLIFGVLAFGAVEEWSTFALEAGASLLFLTWVIKKLVSPNVGPSNNPLYLPAFLFFVLVLAQIVFGRSAYSYVTQYEAFKYVSYGIVLLIAAEAVKADDARKIFALVMTVFGAMYAFFALAQDLTSNSKLFWLRSARFHGAIYGSYVNRDHYAGLMEMLVPIPLALSMSHLLRGGKRALVAFCAVLMATTIFLCGSRGGMITFVLEMVLLAALILGKKRGPRALLGYAAICVFILALISFSSRGQVMARIGDLSPGIRPQITKDSLKMFLKRPILGWGLGTFPTVYPRYRSFYTNLFVNEAHNDYAQLLAEMGLLGFTLAACFLTGMYHRGLSASRRWQNHWDGTVSLAALIGCTGILLHSFVDFNLQIPANAAMFYVLCALAASEPLSESSFARRIRVRAIHDIDTLTP